MRGSAVGYQPPYILLPPHVAPLDMDYYGGGVLDDLIKGHLLISWHGHQPTGNRLVAYLVGEDGLPILTENFDEIKYKIDQRKGMCSRE